VLFGACFIDTSFHAYHVTAGLLRRSWLV